MIKFNHNESDYQDLRFHEVTVHQFFITAERCLAQKNDDSRYNLICDSEGRPYSRNVYAVYPNLIIKKRLLRVDRITWED